MECTLQPAWLNDLLTNFETEKSVIVKSKILQIPKVVLGVLLFIGLILYQGLWKLDFLQRYEMHAHPLIDISQAATNFKHCSSAKGDCDWIAKPANELAYCQGDAICRKYDMADITRIQERGILLVTSIISQHERLTNDLWIETGPAKTYYVQGVEDNMLKLRNRFDAAGVERSGIQAQGILRMKNMTIQRMHCSGFSECPYDTGHWSHLDFCGTDTGADTRTCMSRPMGDYISIALLLEAAGIQLDSIAWEGSSLTRRDTGVPIALGLDYTNLNPWDYWAWPWGTHARYIISPKLVKYSQKDEIVRKEAQLLSDSTRVVTSMKGLYIFIDDKEGVYGEFVFIHFIIQLALSLVILKYAHMAVSLGLTRLYRWSSETRHVGILYEVAAKDETPDAAEVKGASGQEIMQLQREHLLQRAERLSGETCC